RVPPTETNRVLVETEQLGATPGSTSDDVLTVGDERVVAIRLLRTNLFAHEEHWCTGREQGQTERDPRPGFGVRSRRPDQRCSVAGAYDRARGSSGVARLIVGLVINDLVVFAVVERARELLHVERPLVAETGRFEEPGATACHIGVANQIVI